MKTKVKILSFLLAVLLFALSVPVTPVGAATASTDDTETYTKNKVVSVLFDNSGSMSGDKWDYARYALETMLTTLGKNDTLIITPMNDGTKANDGSVFVEVDLKSENRTQIIKDIFDPKKGGFLSAGDPPNGRTPASSIDAARQQLVKKYGMKTTEEVKVGEVSPNEYFLVVLTDGAFDPPGGGSPIQDPDKLATYFKSASIPTYASFQTLYIAFAENRADVDSKNVVDMGASVSLKDASDFTPYLAIGADGIGDVMQRVANRITGRYALEIAVDKNSKTIRIPLDDVPFSLRTVTVLATNTNARFNPAVQNAVVYGNQTPTVTQNAAFSPPTGMTGIYGGFTTVFSLGVGATFSGGEVVMTLDEAPGEAAVVSVLLEPALTLEPIVTHDGVEMDSTDINGKLKTGDTVRISYRLMRQDTGKAVEPTSIDPAFDPATDVLITYNTKSATPDQDVALMKGDGEIGISLSLFDGQYTLYTSLTCKVLDDPNDFRIVCGDVNEKSETLFELPLTVYDDGVALKNLKGYSYKVTAVREDGSDHPITLRESGGVITVTLDVSSVKGEYGTFSLVGEVISPKGDRRTLEDVTIGYYPTGMLFSVVTPENDTHTLEKTLYGITVNDKDTFVFAFGAPDATGTLSPIPFNVSNLSYTLKVGGVDVTDSDTVRTEGNLLYFTPNAEALGELAEKIGEYAVVLEGSFKRGNKPAETMRAEAKLVLTPTAFKLIPTQATGSVDRFRLKGNQSSVYFLVERDGVLLSKEELESVPLNEVFRIHHGSYRTFLSPVRTKATVEEYGDDGAIRVRVCAGHFEPLRGLVTSMLVFGSKLDISATYEDASAVGTIPLKAPNIFSYIWRILLILYIIQLIILALTFKKVKRIPQGVYVRVPLLDPGVDGCDLKGKVIVIKALGWKDYLIFKRLLPFVGLCFWKKNITTSEGVLKYHQNAGVCVDGGLKCLEGEMKPGGSIVSGTLKSKGWSALKPGASFALNKVMLPTVKVIVTPKAAKANIDQPLSGVRGLVVKNKFYLFVNARSVGKKK